MAKASRAALKNLVKTSKGTVSARETPENPEVELARARGEALQKRADECLTKIREDLKEFNCEILAKAIVEDGKIIGVWVVHAFDVK